MADEEAKLEKLVSLKAAKEIDRLSKEIDRERQAKIAEFTERGIGRSGATVKVVINLAAKRADGTREHALSNGLEFFRGEDGCEGLNPCRYTSTCQNRKKPVPLRFIPEHWLRIQL